MATYDYKCQNCKNIKEVIHSMNDNPDILCNACDAKMERLIRGGMMTLFLGPDWGCKIGKYKRAAAGEPLRPTPASKKRVTFASGVSPGKGVASKSGLEFDKKGKSN